MVFPCRGGVDSWYSRGPGRGGGAALPVGIPRPSPPGLATPPLVSVEKELIKFFLDAAFFAYSWKLPASVELLLLTVDNLGSFTYGWSVFCLQF